MKVKVHHCSFDGPLIFKLTSVFIKFLQGMYKRPKNSRFSHCALEFVGVSGDNIISDSTFWGVRSTPKDRWVKKYHIVTSYVFDLNDIDLPIFKRWLNQHDGKSYGFKQIFGLLLRVFHLVKRNPFGKGAAHIICNELVLLFLNRFIELVVAKEFLDTLDLLDTEAILDSLHSRGLCKKEVSLLIT